MDAPAIVVTIAGLLLAGFVIWYFFFSTRQTASAVSSANGVQEVAISVKGGYSPDIIEIQRGKPGKLSFYRDEENSCSEELLMPDFSIRRELPALKKHAGRAAVQTGRHLRIHLRHGHAAWPHGGEIMLPPWRC